VFSVATTNNDLIEILADLAGKNAPNDGRAKKRKAKGLPDDNARVELARTYLKVQHRLWPGLVKAGVLPKLMDSNVADMADRFRESFEADEWKVFQHLLVETPWKDLGVGYLRYSDLGSNPRSLDQQLLNALEKARQFDVFVPWEYVFADAAVTGTVAARRGYQLAKRIMQRGPAEVGALFIDEIGRASRDAIEALHLGKLINDARKRMVGASDGFDSFSPTAKMQLHIYAMIHELFVDLLREKVKRGMRDAFEQGKNIRKPAIGYKLVPVLDENEKPVLDDDGKVVTERVIDEATAPDILKAFTLYGDHSWSRDRIARLFNEKSVGGSQTWDSTRVKQLLTRSTYLGIEYDEMTYHVRDAVTGGVTVKQRPKSEWKRREVPQMRIVPDELGERVAARLAKSREVYDKSRKSEKPSRTELHFKTLVRPMCGVCGKPLWLGRSGKYASFTCLQGKDGKAGCSLKGYKSVRIVENAVIGRVAKEVLTESFVEKLVARANQFLDEQPEVNGAVDDARQLETQVQKKQRAIAAITAQLDNADETMDLTPIFTRVGVLQRELSELKERAKAAKVRNHPKPTHLSVEAVKTLLSEFRDLLRDDIGAAAPALAALTGPVVVTNEVVEEGGEPEWVARFTMNAVPVLLSLALKRDCPTAGALEYLNTGGWTMPIPVMVPLRATLKTAEIAAKAAKMAALGASTETISHLCGTMWQTAKDAVEFAKSGAEEAVPLLHHREDVPFKLNDDQAAELVRLREVEHWPFTRIAKRLGIAESTAVRTYDRLRPEAMKQAIETGQTPKRGSYRHLDRDLLAKVEAKLRARERPEAIATAVGCGLSTVYRERKRLGL